MISLEQLCAAVPGLAVEEVRGWIARDWVRPARDGDPPVFAEVDVARVRLIVDLTTSLEVEERTVPVVLSLLDQLYAARSELRRVLHALDREAEARLLGRLAG